MLLRQNVTLTSAVLLNVVVPFHLLVYFKTKNVIEISLEFAASGPKENFTANQFVKHCDNNNEIWGQCYKTFCSGNLPQCHHSGL